MTHTPSRHAPRADPEGPRELPEAPSGKDSRALPWRAWAALARPEAPSLVLGLLLAAVGSASALVFPTAIGLLVDGGAGAATGTGEVGTGAASVLAPLVSGPDGAVELERLGLVLLALFAVSSFCLALRYLLLANAGERIVRRLRKRVFAAILRQDMAYLAREGTGELTSRLAADCTKVQSLLSEGLVDGFRSVFVATIGIALLVARSPELTGVMLLGLPPVCLLAMYFGLRLSKLSKKVQDALAASTDVAEQRLAQLFTVRILGAEARATADYAASIDGVVTRAYARNRWAAVLTGAATFGVYVAMGLVLWTGAHWMEDGTLTPGTLVEFAIMSAFVAGALTGLVGLWTEVAHARGATARIEEIAERVPQVPTFGTRRLDDWRGDFAFSCVEFAYPSRPDEKVLDGLDLELAPGETVALVGPSGGGKSTIVALLLRLWEQDAGRLTVGGVPVEELDADWLRSRIGVVPQEPALLSGSLLDNLLLACPTADDAAIAAACRAARVDEFTERFDEGLGTPVGEGGRQLSGGQRQRLALARALLRDPRLLILDEATSNLDAESERLVSAALHEAGAGRSVLVIAHRLATVLMADRVAVVDGGRIVEQGSPSELQAAGGLFARWLGWQSTERRSD
ncbi:Multidrug resistance ABC transporter ATP-binding and permease protein [Planctomycetes bacterium Pla163]|uniref:Multidrug resistance ABC transporter ATP-binding and permease protein n=1 Tax=Rohdeia mirabilis TaxID=2528008 RepID=A0A518CZ08_9BACT|nr:Multidrug resistance ABC transporter ATP-binding and permease protein [Planctomycetes bacterium Pla163]